MGAQDQLSESHVFLYRSHQENHFEGKRVRERHDRNHRLVRHGGHHQHGSRGEL